MFRVTSTLQPRTRWIVLRRPSKALLGCLFALFAALCVPSCTALILVYGNFQRGQHLLFQRGGRSATHLSGTHQLASRVIEFNNQMWDSIKVKMGYIRQALPSPSGMPAYETVNWTSPAALSTTF